MNSSKQHGCSKNESRNQTQSRLTSYKEYHKKKQKRRQQSQRSLKSRNNSKDQDNLFSNVDQLFTAEYCTNRFNWLRLITLLITFILLFVCILYCVGSLLTLELDDFWCDKYSWNEIHNYNKEKNESMGAGGCYVAGRIAFDETKLFATNSEENALVVAPNINFACIIKSLVFGIISFALLSIIIKYILVCFVDCKYILKDER